MPNYRQDRNYDPNRSIDWQPAVDTIYRGLASAVGSPIDIFSQAMRPFGYSTPEEEVVMSSEWLGRKMEDMGLISNARNPYAEFAAAMMIPDPTDIMTASKFLGATLVPGIAKHLDDIPTETATVYHGTDKDFEEFDFSLGGTAQGFEGDSNRIFFTDDADSALRYSSLYPQKSKFMFDDADKESVKQAKKLLKKADIDISDPLTLKDVIDLYDKGKIKTKPITEGLFRSADVHDNNRDAIQEAIKYTGKKVFKAKKEGQTDYVVFDPSAIKKVQRAFED